MNFHWNRLSADSNRIYFLNIVNVELACLDNVAILYYYYYTGVVLYYIAFQKDFKPRILYLTCDICYSTCYKRINASLRSLAVNREQCSRNRGKSRGCVYGTNNGELLSYPFPSPSLPPPPP